MADDPTALADVVVTGGASITLRAGIGRLAFHGGQAVARTEAQVLAALQRPDVRFTPRPAHVTDVPRWLAKLGLGPGRAQAQVQLPAGYTIGPAPEFLMSFSPPPEEWHPPLVWKE